MIHEADTGGGVLGQADWQWSKLGLPAERTRVLIALLDLGLSRLVRHLSAMILRRKVSKTVKSFLSVGFSSFWTLVHANMHQSLLSS